MIRADFILANLPGSSVFSVFPAYIPTTMIGGDFYVFHQVDDRHTGILVADISGHGMTLVHASAGHPAPVLIRGSEAKEIPVAGKGIPVGISTDITYHESTVDLKEGDRIVAYTDGLIEVFNPVGEFFGKTRLLSSLEEFRVIPGDKLPDHLLVKVMSWSGKKKDKSLDDDVTAIVVDVK